MSAPSVLAIACLALATGPSWGLGLGRPQTLSHLGQPLHLLIPVELASGETLALECVRGEVYAGDNLVPNQMLRWQLEGEGGRVRAIRLRSGQAMDEPLVSVQLSVGCPALLTRQFTAFMDPPGHNSDLPVADAAVQMAPPASAVATVAAPAPARQARPAPRRRAPEPAQEAVREAVSNAESVATAPRRPARRVAEAPAAPRAAGPRLSLEPADPIPTAGQLAAEAAAASAASAAQQAQTQLQAMERRMSEMQAEQQRTLAALQALRTELEAARRDKDTGNGAWLLGLGVLCAALAASSLLLWRNQRRQQQEAQQSWWSESRQDGASVAPVDPSPGGMAGSAPVVTAPAPMEPTLRPEPRAPREPASAPVTVPMPLTVSPSTPPMPLPSAAVTSPAPLSRASPTLTPPSRPASVPSAATSATDDALAALAHLESLEAVGLQLAPQDDTRPMPISMELTGGGTVTVEELIDLEQQVDFFMVLGQDDAAIELLSSRVGDRAAASGLPYLKLMELYQRRGERDAFDRVASNFSAQFRARAPSWSDDLNEGQGLDAHPQLLDRLQAAWPDPQGSMSLLQDLLSKHQEYSGDLGLPAYRDLLLLYAVARDRAEHEADAGSIDLLLPLDATAGADMMATMVWQSPPSAAGSAPAARSGDSRLLDLDLTLMDDDKDRKGRTG